MRVVNMVVTSHDFVSGLKKCLKFSQLLSCLDEAICKCRKSPVFLTLFTLHYLLLYVFSNHTLCLERYRESSKMAVTSHDCISGLHNRLKFS